MEVMYGACGSIVTPLTTTTSFSIIETVSLAPPPKSKLKSLAAPLDTSPVFAFILTVAKCCKYALICCWMVAVAHSVEVNSILRVSMPDPPMYESVELAFSNNL